MNRNVITLVLLLLCMLPVVAYAETSVSGCGTLSIAGETYILTQDIIDSTAKVCMTLAAHNVTLDCQGHRIDGIDRTKSSSIGVYKPYNTAGTHATVRNCVISDWYTGINMYAPAGAEVTDNRVENTILGIVTQNAPGSVITRNEITGYMLEGITLRRSSNTSVTSNSIHDNNEGYDGKGITTSYDGNHLLIQDNQITDFTGWGIYLYNLLDGGSNLISRNTISNNRPYPGGSSGGIFVLDQLGGEIRNNVMENLGLFGQGILVEGAGFTISENEAFKNHTGIRIEWPWQTPQTGTNTIQNNNMHDNGAGIAVSTSGNIISGNTLHKNVGGISLYLGNGNEIRNNTISECDSGVSINQSTNTIIDGNTIKDSKRYGMWFVLGSGDIVTGNTVCGTGWRDIYVEPDYLPTTGYSASGNRCQTVVGWHDDGVKSGCTFQCLNNPPVAEAGPDQTLQCTGSGTSVRLDGSGSRDPDNDPLTYAWTWPGGSAEGVSPQVLMPLGTTPATLTVDDGNGGKSSDTVSIKVQDTIPPVTTVHSIAGIAGDNGWYRSDVAILVESTDSCSGVKEVRSTVDGAANTTPGSTATISVKGDLVHTVSFGAADNAGNPETPQTSTIKIDQTNPVITAFVSPEPNASGWNNTDVTVTFVCSDALSGIASCPAPVTITAEGAGQVITRTAVDKAGNTASASVTLNIDKTAPVADISAAPNILWPPNHKMVNVAMNGGSSDASSGVASVVITVTDEYGTVQPTTNGFNTTLPLEAWREGTDMDGRHYTITAVITDKAGNRTTVTTEAVCPHDMREK